MDLGTIGTILIIIIIIVIVIRLLNKKKIIYQMTSSKEQVIDASTLELSTTNTQHSTYSIWFYISDWSINFGEKKYIFKRELGSVSSLDVYLHETVPQLSIKVKVLSNDSNFKTCTLSGIELQKWNSLIFSINTSTIDIYMNGEMVQSQYLEGIVNIDSNANVIISPGGVGFNGWNSKFQYWTQYMNPNQVKNIYNQGHGASQEKDLRVNISLYKGDVRRANIVI
uniref:Uncharacterized protein n=1 Tax=viral metagenome TaxID=1070528 RepID=A0A6C0HR37_9ZZZZ